MPSVDYVLCIIFYIIYIYDVIAICDFIEFDYTHKVQGVCYNLCDIHPHPWWALHMIRIT